MTVLSRISSFKEFYWPSLKHVVIGLIEEGCVPVLFIEGRYNTRMEYLQELPAFSTICVFDRSDLDLACEKLAGIACVAGGVKANMLLFGTPEEIKNHCRELIDKHGRRGGFILANGAIVDRCPPANMAAMIEANRIVDNRSSLFDTDD
jgi:uroporphyrinogen-III decarboxylase